jgi:hypothetical protein
MVIHNRREEEERREDEKNGLERVRSRQHDYLPPFFAVFRVAH